MPVIDKKRAVAAGATLCVAAASGIFMQYGAPVQGGAPLSQPVRVVAAVVQAPSSEPGPVDIPRDAPVPEGAPEVTRAEISPILTGPPLSIIPLGEPALPDPLIEAALETDLASVTDAFPEPSAAPDCEAGFTATSAPAAMVSLVLESPCHAGEVVEVIHDGLRVNERLNDGGVLRVNLPAMTEDALFTARLPDGSEVTIDIFMPTLVDYERIALVWQGETGMGLHALEGGASYDEPGHLHANHRGSPDRAKSGEGGFVSVAGSIPGGWNADIYTYPITLIAAGRSPEVSVEAEILAEACDQPTRATLLSASTHDTIGRTELSFGVPGCDAVGEFLVLKNLPRDLKIASN